MDGKPVEWMSVSGQIWSLARCIRWGQACGRWSSQAWRVVLNAHGEWWTFLPTTSYPVPPGKPQLTTGALRNETEKTTGQAGTAQQPTQRWKKQGDGPFGGLVVGADGGIKILIAFWHDFVKGGGQACGFSQSSNIIVEKPDRAERIWLQAPCWKGVFIYTALKWWLWKLFWTLLELTNIAGELRVPHN